MFLAVRHHRERVSFSKEILSIDKTEISSTVKSTYAVFTWTKQKEDKVNHPEVRQMRYVHRKIAAKGATMQQRASSAQSSRHISAEFSQTMNAKHLNVHCWILLEKKRTHRFLFKYQWKSKCIRILWMDYWRRHVHHQVFLFTVSFLSLIENKNFGYGKRLWLKSSSSLAA